MGKSLSGEELDDDKNWNKLYGTYSKLNPNEDKDKKPIENFDKKGNQLWGLFLKCEPEIWRRAKLIRLKRRKINW